MDPIKRLSDLVDLSKPREFPPSITLEKTMQLLNEIHQMGSWYSNKGQDEERAFVFFLRYISIVVEELPKHPCQTSLSPTEKHALDVRTLNAIGVAEKLKIRIKQKYEREKEQAESAQGQPPSELEPPVASTSRASNEHTVDPVELDQLLVPDQQLCPYVRCQSVSMQPIVFQRIIIPNNIPELFLTQQTLVDTSGNNNTRFALLYGRLVTKSVIQLNPISRKVSCLVPCSLESITSRNFRRFLLDSETAEDLPIVGCITSNLAKTCHSGFFRVCQISEMVCIVCPPVPVHNRTILLHLVNMSPSGAPAYPQSALSSTNGLHCAHQHITDSIHATVRKENVQNGLLAGNGGSPAIPGSAKVGKDVEPEGSALNES